MNEEAGSKQSEMLGEAAGSVRAAVTQGSQTLAAPALLIHIEEPTQSAEHERRDGHICIDAARQVHKQRFSRTVQAVKFINKSKQFIHAQTIFIKADKGMYMSFSIKCENRKSSQWCEEDGVLQ